MHVFFMCFLWLVGPSLWLLSHGFDVCLYIHILVHSLSPSVTVLLQLIAEFPSLTFVTLYIPFVCIKQSEVNLFMNIRLRPIQMSNDINITHTDDNYYDFFECYVYKMIMFVLHVILLCRVGEGPITTALVISFFNTEFILLFVLLGSAIQRGLS